jgi:NAD(P)-dependent dehydrogenase (short-subunit alcohol dehydrogenase family)
VAARRGVIVNLSSATAFRARGPGLSGYAAAKHGVQGLTKSLALELGQHSIRVLAVAPASVRTPGTTALRDQILQDGGEDIFEQIAAGMPLRRIGEPDDVARVVVFCASDAAMFMTGSTVLVDAGLLAV